MPQSIHAAGGILGQPDTSGDMYGSLGKMTEYLNNLKELGATVPREGSVKSKQKLLERAIDRTVAPLEDAMLLNQLSFDLSAEETMRAATLPVLLKKQATQLAAAGKSGDFGSGGRVETELRLLINLIEEYLALARIGKSDIDL